MYNTDRKDTFERHQNSKKHLRNIDNNSHHIFVNTYIPSENVVMKSENVVMKSENVVMKSENVVMKSENVVMKSENVAMKSENVAMDSKNVYICKKCNKIYKTKEYLKKHEKNCSGINCLTCPKCMKTFSDRKNKHRHCKMNTCKPASIFEAENVKTIINNNTNNTNQSYNTNSLNTTNITNIYIKDYGKERKDYLLAYDYFFDIIKRPNNNILVKYLKCKNFNPLFPENHSIKYENKCFKIKEDNKWSHINRSKLKNKLYYDCGSEISYVFGKNEDRIRKDIENTDQFELVKKKSDYILLELNNHDKEIKNSMLDVVING
jgi:hypothetical protein